MLSCLDASSALTVLPALESCAVCLLLVASVVPFCQAVRLPSGREIWRQARKVAPDVKMAADVSGVKIEVESSRTCPPLAPRATPL